MRAPNCPYIFRTGLLGVVCLITFEEQPVRDVVRLLAAVMLVVGGSRISVTALGRLVGLGAPPFGAAPSLFSAVMATWSLQSSGGGLVKTRVRECVSVRRIRSLCFWSKAVPLGSSSKRPGTNCVL